MSVLSYQSLKRVMVGCQPFIILEDPARLEDFLQPASLDCPLSFRYPIYRMKAAAIPRRGETVEGLITRFHHYKFEPQELGYLDHKGVFLTRLGLDLALPDGVVAEFSPKSSTGRNDVFVRVLSNQGLYDKVVGPYEGPVYLEMTALSFPARIDPGTALTQMRLHLEGRVLTSSDLRLLHAEMGLLFDGKGESLSHQEVKIDGAAIYLHLDLSGQVAGLEALDDGTEPVPLARKGVCDPREFWRPVSVKGNGEVILSPGKFYLLHTREFVHIPPSVCAVMKAYDVEAGEYRSHYAGFFDSGFGSGEPKGTVAVLEVRVRDIPFRACHGQPICKLAFDQTDLVPERLYGAQTGSHYTERGPSLGKNFTDRHEVWREGYWK